MIYQQREGKEQKSKVYSSYLFKSGLLLGGMTAFRIGLSSSDHVSKEISPSSAKDTLVDSRPSQIDNQD